MRWAARLRALGAALLIALSCAPAAHAEEAINEFISDVRVQPNGELDVTETITVFSELSQIQHGIQRDFPTRYRNLKQGLVNVGFEVVSVTLDGKDEPFELMGLENGKRVQIGRAEAYVSPGRHVYQIRYRTTRQLGFFPGYDELYWNATGTGWRLPIERAEARVTLPSAAKFGDRAVYTGPQGATDKNAEVVSEEPGRIVFQTTRRLETFEGLTIAVAWPKGVIAEPSAATRRIWMLQAQGPRTLAGGGVVAILLYMLFGLWRAKTNPHKKPATPLFEPPEDLTAAGVRRVWKAGFDDRAFTAAIVDSAVRGRLRIVEEEGEGLFKGKERRLEKTDSDAPLRAAEAAMVRELFVAGPSIALVRDNHPTLIRARRALSDQLEAALGNDRYSSYAAAKANHGWIAAAALVTLTAAFCVWANTPDMLPFIALAAIAGLAVELWRRRLAAAREKAIDKSVGSLLAIFGLFAVLAVLGLTVVVLGFSAGDIPPMIIALLSVGAVLFCKIYMNGPTPDGWRLRGEIEGFRHYLSVAEEDRLERLHPPEKTVALFERFLPYAIALQVETRWAERFAKVLAAAATDPSRDSDTSWYSGDRGLWSRPTALASAVGASLASTVASAATAPSSSSGSSGGGSSGGGGGGGGGGGW